MKHIFLSYSSKDSAYANWLDVELKSNDYAVWRDTGKIRGGDEWIDKLEAALQDAWAVVVIQSPHSKDSRWVRNETEYAEKCHLPIIPILLSGDPWFGFLHTQYVDVRGHENEPLPDSFYDTLLQYAPPESLDKEIDLRLLQSNTPQRLGLIPKLEALGRNGHSPKGYAARQFLQRLSYDSDEYVRVTAATALRKLKEPQQQEPDITLPAETKPEPVPSPTRWIVPPQRRRPNQLMMGGAVALLVLLAAVGGWLIGHSGRDDTKRQVEQSLQASTSEVALVDLCPDSSAFDRYNDPCIHDEDDDDIPDEEDDCPTDAYHDPISDPCNHDEDMDTFNDTEDECPLLTGMGQGCSTTLIAIRRPSAGPITPENASQVVQLAQDGRGWAQNIAWESDGETQRLVVVSEQGAWHYDPQHLDVEPEHVPFVSDVYAAKDSAFTADRTRMAYISDNQVQLVDLTTGENIFRFEGHGYQTNSIDISPDGLWLASGSGNDDWVFLRLWDMTELGFQCDLNSHAEGVLDVAFNPDSTLLASASIDGTVRLWNVAGCTEIGLLPHDRTVRSLAWSPDGSRLITNADSLLQLWDVATQTEIARIDSLPNQVRGVSGLTFSPDGSTVVYSYWNVIDIVDVESFSIMGDMGTSNETYANLVYSPDGKFLASTSQDGGPPIIWNMETQIAGVLPGHEGQVHSVAFSPDGSHFAATGKGGTVRLWETDSGILQYNLNDRTGYAWDVIFSPDGASLAAGTRRRVPIWDVASGELRQVVQSMSTPSIAYNQQGTLIATVAESRQIALWDTETVQQQALLEGFPETEDGPVVITFNPDGTLLAAGTDCPTEVQIWDVASGEVLMGLSTHVGEVRDLAFSPDGMLLATASSEGLAKLWDMTTGNQVAEWPIDGRGASVAFSPNGSLLAFSAEVGIWLVDVSSQGVVAELDDGNHGTAFDLAFSPNGSLLLSGNSDGTVRLWGIPAE